MADFRTVMYDRYVSSFTGRSAPSESALHSYLEWCRHRYLPLVDDLDRHGRILDLGCGTGDMLEFLRRSGFTNVEGIDRSREQVQIATGRGLPATGADAMAYLAEHSKGYDAIVAIDVLEHFSKDELVDLVALVHGALADGGVFIVQTINGSGLFPGQVAYGDFTHMTILAPESLEQLLTVGGFRDFTFTESGPVSKDLRGILRVFGWSAIRMVASLARKIETGKRQAIWTENLICRCRKAPSRGTM
jgi:2-polyprenyl-3-methyl-5-hydroxy-6-metoxy-1,4-benzoquinol methylase